MTDLSARRLAALFAQAGVDDFPQKVCVVCAVSGGLDSMVLVHALAAAGCALRAVHVDHASHPDSAGWSEHVVQRLARLSVPVSVHRIAPPDRDVNLEAYWRRARSEVFARDVKSDEVLVTAHHQNDQAETLLLQLLRGAGPTGLQAMPASQTLKSGARHVRPLLGYTRAELLEYARQHALEWIDDPSNANERFDRNFLRQQIVPMLHERWPAATSTLARSAELIAETVSLTEGLAAGDARISHDGLALEWSGLAALPEARQANAVRYWIDQLGERFPPRDRLGEALRQWRAAASDRQPQLELEYGTVHRYRQSLHYVRTAAAPARGWSGSLHCGEWLELPAELGQVGWMADVLPSSDQVQTTWMQAITLPTETQLRIGFRQNGERLRRSGGHHQSLKHWFQDHGVPPPLRGRLPLVFWRDELIAVAGHWLDARFRGSGVDAGGQKISSLVWRA